MYRFLNVDPDVEFKEFKTYNSSGVPKNKALHKIITHPLVPLPSFIKNLNISYRKPPMQDETKAKLYKTYESDLKRVESMFGLKISHQ